MENLNKCIELLQSERKIDREKGIIHIENMIKENQTDILMNYVYSEWTTCSTSTDWKKCNAILSITKLLLNQIQKPDDLEKFINFALIQLQHTEFRVRIESGNVLFVLSQINPDMVFNSSINTIMDLIRENLARQDLEVPKESYFEINETERLFHDTSGWKFLETSIKALQNLIKGCDTRCKSLISPDIVLLLIKCSEHVNRFVRETSMYVFEDLFNININTLLIQLNLFDTVCACLVSCLSDNWSQVRLSASIASRKLLVTLENSDLIPASRSLLPPICLNRHYIAEGVKIYNLKTWDLVTKGNGKEIVGRNINDFVDFYIFQSQADNHAVREASCLCLAELSCLLSDKLNLVQIEKIYQTLLICFNDDSWPVRDTACSALSYYMAQQSEFFSDKLEKVFPLFFKNLTNSIPSVRTGAAVSLCYISNSFPMESKRLIEEFFATKLLSVENQQPDAEKCSTLSKEPAVFGVVPDQRTNDPHADQIMFSCGSLAPKMRSGKFKECCSDHGFTRQSQPWEITDGCFSLIGELSKFYSSDPVGSGNRSFIIMNNESSKIINSLILSCLLDMSKALSIRSYSLYSHLLQTFISYLPHLINFIGIDLFKNTYFELFADFILYATAQATNEHLSITTGECFNELKEKFGQRTINNMFVNYYGEALLKSSRHYIN